MRFGKFGNTEVRLARAGFLAGATVAVITTLAYWLWGKVGFLWGVNIGAVTGFAVGYLSYNWERVVQSVPVAFDYTAPRASTWLEKTSKRLAIHVRYWRIRARLPKFGQIKITVAALFGLYVLISFSHVISPAKKPGDYFIIPFAVVLFSCAVTLASWMAMWAVEAVVLLSAFSRSKSRKRWANVLRSQALIYQPMLLKMREDIKPETSGFWDLADYISGPGAFKGAILTWSMYGRLYLDALINAPLLPFKAIYWIIIALKIAVPFMARLTLMLLKLIHTKERLVSGMYGSLGGVLTVWFARGHLNSPLALVDVGIIAGLVSATITVIAYRLVTVAILNKAVVHN